MGQPPTPFPLGSSARHLCIDMQRVFAEHTPWQVPWLPRVLPCVQEIAQRQASSTIFTRFIPPESPEAAEGAWRDYYTVWSKLTRRNLSPELLDLVPSLRRLAPPARVIDKSNSAFTRRGFAAALRRSGVTTLVISGGETDVCVLATVMDAVDYGFRVVLPTDALCSSRDSTHDALLSLYRVRFTQQIEATTTEDLLGRWGR